MCSGERYYQGALHQYVREALWKHLARVVQTLDSTIHRTNHYPADKY